MMIKKFWKYWVLIMIAIACNENVVKENNMILNDEIFEFSADNSEVYLQIIEQRLKEQLDILKLNNDHPDFVITESGSTIFKKNISQELDITNVVLLNHHGNNDTTFLNVLIKLKDQNLILLDTIDVKIISKNVIIEGERKRVTQVKF